MPLPSAFLNQLKEKFVGEVSADQETLARHSHDASLFEIKPQLVVFPKHSQDIQALVQAATAHRVPLAPYSGGTDMSGGPLTDSVSVDLHRHLTHINPVQDNTITIQPGAFYHDLEPVTLQQNLLMPSYPASREICTVGGMVANDSGGEKTLKYGKTADYVQKLKVVLSDGREYTFQKLDSPALQQKLRQTDFEGQIYTKIFNLLEKNYDLIQSAKPHVSKNSTGYALWDVWDRSNQILDLTRLFTGSQGTLGIITEITFRLIKPHPHSQMIIMFLPDLDKLAPLIKQILRYDPETFESYDHNTLKLALKFLPQLIRQMKAKNFLALGLSLLPELGLILRGGLPRLILLAEITGTDPHEVTTRALAAATSAKSLGIRTRIAHSKTEVQKYWTIRRESFNLLRKKIKNKRTAPFIDDLIVAPEHLPNFLPRLQALLSQYPDLTYTIAGHIGDGNFHIIPLMDPTRPDFKTTIDKLSHQVYNLVFEFHGSMSGEHNDGLIRSHYLEQMYGPQVYDLFKQTKNIFDPHNIFNPGKKINPSWANASQHLVTSLPV